MTVSIIKPRLAPKVLKAAGVLAAVVLTVHERSLVASSFEAATEVKWVWLVLAIQLEVLSMASFSGIPARLLRASPTRVRLLPVMKAVFAGNALSATVPVAGSQMSVAYLFRRLKQLGVEGTVAAWALIVAGVASSLASALLLVTGAVLSGNAVAAAAGAAGGLIGAAAFTLGILAIRRPALRGALLRPVGWVLRKTSRLLGRPVEDPDQVLNRGADRLASLHLPATGWATVAALALLNWLADIGVLAASISAVGAPVPWRGLLLAYGVGAAATTLGLTPGGVGVVEAALALALMGAGVRHPLALAAVLVYRLVSFWMVNSLGWLVYLRSGRVVRSHRPGQVDLDLPGAVTNLEPRQRPRPVGQLREQNIA